MAAAMHQVIVFHHTQDEHVEAFAAFMARVQSKVAGADGLREFSAWRGVGTSRLVAGMYALDDVAWRRPVAFAPGRPALGAWLQAAFSYPRGEPFRHLPMHAEEVAILRRALAQP
jgi:hypothetical protein